MTTSMKDLINNVAKDFMDDMEEHHCVDFDEFLFVNGFEAKDVRDEISYMVNRMFGGLMIDDGSIIYASDDSEISYREFKKEVLKVIKSDYKYKPVEESGRRVFEDDDKSAYERFQDIINGSIQFDFDGSILNLMGYYTGDRVKLDLDNLSKSEFNELLAKDYDEDEDDLVELFLKYHDDPDNYYAHKDNFEKMYQILDKYGSNDQDVDVRFEKATYSDQKEMLALITPKKEDAFKEFKRILHGSKSYNFDDTVLTIEGYYDGTRVSLDLGNMDEDTFENLVLEDDYYDESKKRNNLVAQILEGKSVRKVLIGIKEETEFKYDGEYSYYGGTKNFAKDKAYFIDKYKKKGGKNIKVKKVRTDTPGLNMYEIEYEIEKES